MQTRSLAQGLLALALAPLPAMAASNDAQRAPTHCTGQEIAVFSCSVGKKTVSFCALPDAHGGIAQAQYRFGAIGDIELSIPPQPGAPAAFAKKGFTLGPSYSQTYLSAANGAYAYTVYSGEGRGWQRAGLLVTRQDKMLTNLRCTRPDTTFNPIIDRKPPVFPAASGELTETWFMLIPD